MARQSIVDFFKDAQTTPQAVAPVRPSISHVAAEMAYVSVAKPVMDALSGGTPLSERELFVRSGVKDFAQFRLGVEEMKTRGLVQVVQYEQPFNDPIYGLAVGTTPG